MKTKHTIALCLLLAATACSSIQEEPVNTERAKSAADEVFYATLEQSGPVDATKVYADENLKVLWNADDRITIYNRYTYGYQYAFQGATGKTAGAFAKVDGDDEFVVGNPLEKIYAIYPHSIDNEIDNNGNLCITWPSSQTYKAESFGIGANVMVSVTDDNQLRFRNVGGYLAIKLYGDNVSVSSITLRGNNGEKLSGRATVTCASEAEPTLTFQSASSESLRLECPAPVSIGSTAETATTFWLVVPPTEFTQGFNITVRTNNGLVFVKSTDIAYEIERNTLHRMAAVEVIPSDIVPFADANFKAYCVTNFDADNDGEISISEALDVTSIIVSTNNIKTLQGVEFFKNLEYLTCNGMWDDDSQSNFGLLTSLDVSANTALTHLSCYQNQLTALNVSNNTALTYLSCSNNQLTVLDVRNLSNLREIHCNGPLSSNEPGSDRQYTPFGSLSYLNISGCTALEYLSCSSNGDNLTNIVGLKDCKNLTIFDGYYNDFKQLDFSGNPELTSIYLAGNIHLESLDITKCIKLNWMSLWDSRSLHSIDLSHNTQLEELWAYHLSNADLGDNQSITSLNVWAPASGFQFSELPHLTYLGVWNCHNLDLSGNPAIEGLYIGEGCTGTINIANLSELNSLNVCNGSLVESIDISNNLKITHYNSAQCSTLKTLIVSSEQVIAGVTENRSEEFIHPNTEIVIKQ